MKKLIALFLTIVMIATLTVMASPLALAEEKIPLKISHHPYFHGLPTTYAIENNLYDAFDYTVDYYAGGPVQNEAIASGAWEVGTTGVGGAVLGIPGYNMKILGVAQDEAVTMDAWCRSDSPLASATRDEAGVLGTAEDWKGLTILIATGTNTHLCMINTLQHLGLSEEDVNIVDCSSVPNIYTAFMAGEGDVAFLWAPYGYTLMLDEAYTKVCDISMFGVALPTLVICTEEAYLNRPEVVKQWLAIYYKAAEGLLADPEAGAEMLNDFEEEQGIVMTMETARMEFEYRPLLSLADAKKFFEPNENGTTDIYDIIMNYAAFNVSQGKMTQEQYEAMGASDFVSDFILTLE